MEDRELRACCARHGARGRRLPGAQAALLPAVDDFRLRPSSAATLVWSAAAQAGRQRAPGTCGTAGDYRLPSLDGEVRNNADTPLRHLLPIRACTSARDTGSKSLEHAESTLVGRTSHLPSLSAETQTLANMCCYNWAKGLALHLIMQVDSLSTLNRDSPETAPCVPSPDATKRISSR